MSNRSKELEWLQRRRTGVGSSDAPVLVLGSVYNRTPLDTYLSKKTEPEIKPDNPDFRRGHTYEVLAAALYEEQSGIKIHVPLTDDERYFGFMRRDPDRDWVYADFDGICDDGWVLEVKSPRQRNCDKIRMEGAHDYYQIQCHYLAHVANVAAELPGVGDKYHGKIKGTRLVIYEPENVDLVIIELPYDQEMVDGILNKVDDFWKNHVLTDMPPVELSPAQPPPRQKSKSGKGGKYVPVKGPAWEEAEAAYLVAQQLDRVATARLKHAKETIKDVMEAAAMEAVMTPNGVKFSYNIQAGRKTFDKKKFQAENPQFDLTQYDKQGDPFMMLRAYNTTASSVAGDTLDDSLVTLRDELLSFAGLDLDPEQAIDEFDSLRDQAELYEKMLLVEADGIRNGLKKAAEAMTKKVAGK